MKVSAFSSSLQWATVAQISRQIIQLATTIALAKILMPEDFGVISLATSLISFLNLFRDVGTGSAIIRSEDTGKKLLSSIYWLNIFIGAAASLLLFISAPFIGNFFNQPILIKVLEWLSLVFIINGFSVVQQALFEKEMQFKKLAQIEIISIATGSAAAIIIAVKFHSVLCFPVQMLITSSITSFLLFFSSGWLPQFVFSKREIIGIARYSVNLTGFGFVNYFARNLDNLIIGKFLGTTALGYYSLAYKIILFPIQNISSVVSRVMFPALSKITNEEFLKTAYLNFLELIAFISFPLMVWIFVVDDLLVNALLSDKWQGTITLIRIFVPIGIIQSLAFTTGTLYMIKSKTSILFIWGIISTLLIGTSFLIGVKWGVTGVAISYSIIYIFVAYFDFTIPFRFIGLSIGEMLLKLKQPFLLSIGLGVLVVTIKLVLSLVAPDKTILNFTILALCSILYMIFFIRKNPELLLLMTRNKTYTTN